MARREEDREDLFAEARNLSPRIEVELPTDAFVAAEFPDGDINRPPRNGADATKETVVAGRRRDGGWTFYFGQDPMFGFTAAGELRRAFWHGSPYRAHPGRRLVKLQRHRADSETVLLAETLTLAAATLILVDAQSRLAALLTFLQDETSPIPRAEPAASADETRRELREWLVRVLSSPIAIADGL